MAMVGMIVGDENRIEAGAFGREKLFAKIRPAIDEQRLFASFDQN